MDVFKCRALKQQLASVPAPQIISIERFFDGNDDQGSIGCNLPEHPGIKKFRDILASLAKRSDVEGVYAQITELDPGDDSWPFTDTVVVVGSIPVSKLREALAELEPDEVDLADPGRFPSLSKSTDKANSARVVWWD